MTDYSKIIFTAPKRAWPIRFWRWLRYVAAREWARATGRLCRVCGTTHSCRCGICHGGEHPDFLRELDAEIEGLAAEYRREIQRELYAHGTGQAYEPPPWLKFDDTEEP